MEKENSCLYGRTLDERERFCRFCSAACPGRIDPMKPIYENLQAFEAGLKQAWDTYNEGSRYTDGFEDNFVELAYSKGFRDGYLFAKNENVKGA